MMAWRNKLLGGDVMPDVLYKSSDVMKRLGLKESTFKKYYSALQKEGYTIEKSSNHYVFTEEDIETLEMFMKMIQYDGMTIESVAKEIGKSRSHGDITDKKESYSAMSLASKLLKEQQEQFELQRKKEEIQLISKVQDIAEEKTERLEAAIKELNQQNKDLMEANKKIVELLTKKKGWQFWKK